MKREGVRPTVVTFSALISACEKGQQWKLALAVLDEMKSTFGPNVIAYSAAISALSKGQQWEKAWELFCEIEQSGEKLSVVTYNATMTALEKGLQWQRALDLFDEMKYKNMAVTVVSYGSAISACEKGYQWRQCLEYLDEMTERKIPKNVIIFGAAMSCMEKACRADIAFQLMERMNLEGVRPNVHIYNSAISACARCKLWKKGFELFREMDEVRIKRDVVTYNAVLDAVCSQVDLAKQIFHEGVERGFYAKVSRLGTQWLELDLHFLSLGGGETALRWWFEECLVPYLGNSTELASVKSIDIVTGYGKTRARGARKGDDGMRKRVRAMLSFMNVSEVDQPNLGRIHIDKDALTKEVEKNNGRIIFDALGYEEFKLREGLDDAYVDAEQFVRPRGGAVHSRTERDRQGEPPEGYGGQEGGNGFGNDHPGPMDNRRRPDDGNYENNQGPPHGDNFGNNQGPPRGDYGRNGGERRDDGYIREGGNYHNDNPRFDNRNGERDDFRGGPGGGRPNFSPPNRHPQDQGGYPTQGYNDEQHQPPREEWPDREPNRPPPQARDNWREPAYDRGNRDFGGQGGGYDGRQNFNSPGRYNDRKRPYDGGYNDDPNYGSGFNTNNGGGRNFNSYQDDGNYGGGRRENYGDDNGNYGGRREQYGDNSYPPNKRFQR